MLSAIRAGYTKRSLGALASLVALYALVVFVWPDLFDFSAEDPLFCALWLVMSALLCFRVEPSRDLLLAIVALGGGLTIEAWGTVTNLWTYDTAERPPLWIVPAWPVATLAIDRLGRLVAPRIPSQLARGTRFVLMVFVVWMVVFARPTWSIPATWGVVVFMLLVVATTREPRVDMALFVAGAGLGIFLEYWGTSRACWTYYDKAIPPPVAAFAHGFASVAFQRGARVIEQIRQRRIAAATPRVPPGPVHPPPAGPSARLTLKSPSRS